METVIDSSIWIEHLRARGSKNLRHQAHDLITGAGALLCEPIVFELLRASPARQLRLVEAQLATVPVLPTPLDLWSAATKLGQKCVAAGFLPSALDLLIAQACIHHSVSLTTFDSDFSRIAKVSALQLHLLTRAG